ncbi:MAG: lysophospholipid acyltransferase family protein [Actinomycetes bacterium]
MLTSTAGTSLGFRPSDLGDAHVMASTRNPLVHLARHSPAPLDALLQIAAAVLGDTAALAAGDDNFDAWDSEHIARTLPLLNPLMSAYFRSEVRGIENVPPTGSALLVGNHSGGTMIVDTFLFTFAFYDHFGPDRRFHQLAHDIAARIPGLRRFGTLVASHANAQRAFAVGAPVLVYPGGDVETFRPSWHSDRIEFAGRKGFVRLALAEGVPIVPVVSIGGQETALFLTRAQHLARAMRLDRYARVKVLPISIGPPFGLNLLDMPGRLPLPAKITIEVLPPIDLRERFGPRPDADAVYEHVTSVMQGALDKLADERTLPFLG